jgi:hypothetical protein
VAFGATFILPAQTNYKTGKVAAGQWIYAKQRRAPTALDTDKEPQQIQP